jgi:hypothetical protein
LQVFVKSEIAFLNIPRSALPDQNAVLNDVLRSERAAGYRQVTEAAWVNMREEKVDRDLFSLSRKLKLSAGQEKRLREILVKSASEKLTVPGTHISQGTDLFDRMRTQLDSRRQRLWKEMEKVLTPEQYSASLSHEMNSSKRHLNLPFDLPLAANAGGAESNLAVAVSDRHGDRV